jgi:hypothetical protein
MGNVMQNIHRSILTAIILLSVSNVVMAAKPNKLSKIFDYEMLNVDVAYFEKVAGVAKNTNYDGKKNYKVDGCEIHVDVTGGTVQSLSMELSNKCTFDLKKFLPNISSLSAHKVTFGKFDSEIGETGRFYSDCISGCGNAADPHVYMYWDGSRADRFLGILLDVVQVNDPVLNAVDKWRAAMQKVEGDDWVTDTKFNCPNQKNDPYNSEYNIFVHKTFKDVTISAITIGYGIQEKDVAEMIKFSECK